MIFSVMLLPITNPDWLRDMSLGRIGANLVEITLEMILLMKLLKLMGLNSVREFGNSTFGSRIRHEFVIYLGTLPPKKANTTLKRSALIISQHDW